MRVIKFRGKDANGEWKEGSLITDKYQRSDGKQFDVAFIVSGLPCVELPDDMWTAKMQRVNPTTVGQFTGLHDKNGKEIYEGDIVSIEAIKSRINKVVEWNSERACWDAGGENRIDLYAFCYCEVIGNIYDNSELLEGGEE